MFTSHLLTNGTNSETTNETDVPKPAKSNFHGMRMAVET